MHVLDAGFGLHGPTEAAVSQLLASQPGLAAVYSVGGANAAILSAFERAGRSCRVFIGHDTQGIYTQVAARVAPLRTVARYAFWVEDLQSRVDPALAGNTKGPGEPMPASIGLTPAPRW